MLGQPVIIDYKAGAGGVVASQHVMSLPADGYTYILRNSGMVTVPLVQKRPSYDPLNDFMAAALIGTSPMVLMANASAPGTLVDFVAHARTNPGGLEWGSSALGGAG